MKIGIGTLCIRNPYFILKSKKLIISKLTRRSVRVLKVGNRRIVSLRVHSPNLPFLLLHFFKKNLGFACTTLIVVSMEIYFQGRTFTIREHKMAAV